MYHIFIYLHILIFSQWKVKIIKGVKPPDIGGFSMEVDKKSVWRLPYNQ